MWNRRKKQELFSIRGGKVAAELMAGVPQDLILKHKSVVESQAAVLTASSIWRHFSRTPTGPECSLGSAPGRMYSERGKNQPNNQLFLHLLWVSLFFPRTDFWCEQCCRKQNSMWQKSGKSDKTIQVFFDFVNVSKRCNRLPVSESHRIWLWVVQRYGLMKLILKTKSPGGIEGISEAGHVHVITTIHMVAASHIEATQHSSGHEKKK